MTLQAFFNTIILVLILNFESNKIVEVQQKPSHKQT